MAPKLTDARDGVFPAEELVRERDRALAAHGVRVPSRPGAISYRPVPRRPKWLAFVIRLFT
jgi:hypothetical protein